MWKFVFVLVVCATFASARPGEDRDWEDWLRGPSRRPERRPPPPMKEFGEMTRMMLNEMKGALMDFIGAEMYGAHIFKKMTVILTPDQQQKYASCVRADLEKMKANKDSELTPMEREFVLDRHLGACMLKARFGYTDEKIEQLECCSIKAYMWLLINSGRRSHGPKDIRSPPGFRMVEAEFGCFMNMTYGFSIDNLKQLKECVLKKEGVNDQDAAEKLLAILNGEESPDEEERAYKKGLRLASEEDIEDCLKQVKPNMPEQDIKDVAFVNTKKREVAAEKAAKREKNIAAAKRLLSLLEKADN